MNQEAKVINYWYIKKKIFFFENFVSIFPEQIVCIV